MKAGLFKPKDFQAYTIMNVSNLGFPRMGANRELKKLVESYWKGSISQSQLEQGASDLRVAHWKLQKNCGVDIIPSNDFSLYDHMLDTAFGFGVIDQKYRVIPSKLDQYFAMGRGLQRPLEGIDVPACEMKKWFDTNYHYIVPTFSQETTFELYSLKAVQEFVQAKTLGIQTRPVLVGPVSFLALGKPSNANLEFDPLSLLDQLLPVYAELLNQLSQAGAEWIQLDEPVLALDSHSSLQTPFEKAYAYLKKHTAVKVMLVSYFDSLMDNVELIDKLPIAGLHLDLVRAPGDLELVSTFKNKDWVFSLGLVNGRNIWKTGLAHAIHLAKSVLNIVGKDRVILAPSCSLLHSPHSLAAENKMDVQIKSWLSFAVEKLDELKTISLALTDDTKVTLKLQENAKDCQSRRVSPLIHDPAVKAELDALKPGMFTRQNPFEIRSVKQQARLQLPLFPTTTVGSFPQTKEVRLARQKFKRGEWTLNQYDDFCKSEIQKAVAFQESAGLDLLVHGEFERNDMVEFFGEHLKGYTFSQNGWVQSYGSRCVKPPIIFGDVSRPNPMTVETSVYAQSLTSKPMKGMLTGPITMLQWSFVRDDQPRQTTAFQIALALRKEVSDLEKAGLAAIQIDEPAIREGLPLKKKDQAGFLKWAVDAFLLSSTGVSDETQIHSHMCYSDFNDIFDSIKAMDTDCMTIENSKSDLKLLQAFKVHGYGSGIGPGLYDIHSPRVPSVDEMKSRLKAINEFIPTKLLWVNPDCGLKTRGWPETELALENMCKVAQVFRAASVA